MEIIIRSPAAENYQREHIWLAYQLNRPEPQRRHCGGVSGVKGLLYGKKFRLDLPG